MLASRIHEIRYITFSWRLRRRKLRAPQLSETETPRRGVWWLRVIQLDRGGRSTTDNEAKTHAEFTRRPKYWRIRHTARPTEFIKCLLTQKLTKWRDFTRESGACLSLFAPLRLMWLLIRWCSCLSSAVVQNVLDVKCGRENLKGFWRFTSPISRLHVSSCILTPLRIVWKNN